MANVYEPEQESDEDCEVYFLKPVNEYNIVDKIKEANKELFSKEQNDNGEEDEESDEATLMNRKVKFAPNLEEYEPQSGISNKELEEKLGKEDTAAEEEDLNETKEQKLEVIKEEECSVEIENSGNLENPENLEDSENLDNSENPISEDQQTVNDMNRKDSKEADLEQEDLLNNTEMIQEDIILEEICEEILIMDMEENLDDKTESPGTLQRKMLKQITFDYDEEQDNKSLTNLLICDNDNDDDEGNDSNEEYNCNESLNEETDSEEKLISSNCNSNNNNEYYDDDEEDDKLSIIVASYLPDDLACDKTSLTSDKCSSPHSCHKSRKLPFNKRFSFRRKTKSSNAIASCSGGGGGGGSNMRRFMPPPEVTDLKLHYKTCCEFKNAQQKLPKYTGYLSEYGLSREQLIERDHKLQQKERGLLHNTLKTSDDEMRKMHDNERAFTKWLKNKMRFPINKTRNMFDVKRPFGLRKSTSVGGGGGGNSLINEDSSRILNTTKYRSISAKLKRK